MTSSLLRSFAACASQSAYEHGPVEAIRLGFGLERLLYSISLSCREIYS